MDKKNMTHSLKLLELLEELKKVRDRLKHQRTIRYVEYNGPIDPKNTSQGTGYFKQFHNCFEDGKGYQAHMSLSDTTQQIILLMMRQDIDDRIEWVCTQLDHREVEYAL